MKHIRLTGHMCGYTACGKPIVDLPEEDTHCHMPYATKNVLKELFNCPGCLKCLFETGEIDDESV